MSMLILTLNRTKYLFTLYNSINISRILNFRKLFSIIAFIVYDPILNLQLFPKHKLTILLEVNDIFVFHQQMGNPECKTISYWCFFPALQFLICIYDKRHSTFCKYIFNSHLLFSLFQITNLTTSLSQFQSRALPILLHLIAFIVSVCWVVLICLFFHQYSLTQNIFSQWSTTTTTVFYLYGMLLTSFV